MKINEIKKSRWQRAGTVGYLSKAPKAKVRDGAVVRIDVNGECTPCDFGCKHETMLYLSTNGTTATGISSEISHGAEIQSLYMMLGSPGWVGDLDHFERYTGADSHALRTVVLQKIDGPLNFLRSIKQRRGPKPAIDKSAEKQKERLN